MVSKNNKGKGEQSADLSKWAKMFRPNEKWVKDDLLDVVAVVKQIVAILIGLVWGCIPLLGSTGIISFLGFCIFITFMYYTLFLKVDDEEFGRFELIKEGLFPSFALFLLSWTAAYNTLHISS